VKRRELDERLRGMIEGRVEDVAGSGGGRWPGGRRSHFGWLEVGVIGADFGEFSARPYAKAVFRCVIRVPVIKAPECILLVVHVANNRRRDQNDGYADDHSSNYKAFHFDPLFPSCPPRAKPLNV
jgi:hypothetical protein